MAERPILIIPARGGSKRLPRKNILLLDDRPLLAHVIANGADSGLFSQIIVSTEDSEIAAVAERGGATVHDRPSGLAGDRNTVTEVCHAVLELWPATTFCCIYPTAPLLRSRSIRSSYELLCGGTGTDFVMGVSRYHHPPVQAMKIDEAGFGSLMWPEYEKVQSQFHPDLCVSNGTLYWARSSAFHSTMSFYGPRLKPFFVPEDEVCDINVAADFDCLRQMYEAGHCR